MGVIYYCAVPEDEPDFSPDLWELIVSEVEDGMFLYTNDDFESRSGFYIPIRGEEITSEHDDIQEYYTYYFSPSNISIEIFGDSFLNISIGKFRVSIMVFDENENRPDLKIRSYLDKKIENQKKQRGRELTSLKEINSIPNNVKGLIGNYLVGERGNVKKNGTRKKISLASHIDKQKQSLGHSLAPRVRGGRSHRR